MEIRELAQETYAGRKFTARYQTHGYYDIRAAEDGFRRGRGKGWCAERQGKRSRRPCAWARAGQVRDCHRGKKIPGGALIH